MDGMDGWIVIIIVVGDLSFDCNTSLGDNTRTKDTFLLG